MNSSILLSSSPATAALDMLEQQQSKLNAVNRGGASSNSLSKLSFRLCDMNFDDHHLEESFPVIEWDHQAEDDVSEASTSSDDSIKSLDAWNSIFHSNDFGSSSSLGKRSRGGGDDDCDSSSSTACCRRLVRSKKIKSGLSSLAVSSFAARSA